MFPKHTKSTATGRVGEVASVLAMTRCPGVSRGKDVGQVTVEEQPGRGRIG